MSNYPLGAEFDPNAPWNQKEPRMIKCTECGGTGYEGYYGRGIQMLCRKIKESETYAPAAMVRVKLRIVRA